MRYHGPLIRSAVHQIAKKYLAMIYPGSIVQGSETHVPGEKKVRFWRVTELITTLMEAHADRQLVRLRGRLSKLDLLALDELGYVPA